MINWPKHIVIVGGGTAGWLAALMLTHAIQKSAAKTRITMVESSKIPTIGVGEGTTAVFRQILKQLDIDEFEFIKETGATIKYGIQHKDWRKLGHTYDGPIDDPNILSGLSNDMAWLDVYAVATRKSVADAHLFTHLSNDNKAPFAYIDNEFVPAGPFHYAFHFDQSLASDFLKGKAKNIRIIDDVVIGANLNGQTGNIESLSFENGQSLNADFYLDCSGFSRCVIKHTNTKWQSYRDVLPVNRAMPFWMDIADGDEIEPFTLAWAQKSGWMWKIPTQQRYGCGYVYSDAHISPDQAQQEIEAILGCSIEPRADIKINSGRLENVWCKNCVALGLSSSFLEPLEATSIHATIVQLLLLTDFLSENNPMVRQKYNVAIAQQVDDFRDFIRCHYVSERRDSDFWQDVANETPKNISDKIDFWHQNMPASQHFKPFLEGLPHVEHQLYTPVLDGLGLLSKNAAKAELDRLPRIRKMSRMARGTLMKEYKSATEKSLGHREFLRMI